MSTSWRKSGGSYFVSGHWNDGSKKRERGPFGTKREQERRIRQRARDEAKRAAREEYERRCRGEWP